MAAATVPRDTKRWGGGGSERLYEYQLAASTTILPGTLVGLNASGLLVPMTAVNTLRCVGRAEESKVSGASGVTMCKVSTGTFKWANGAAPAVAASRGTRAYAEDNQTVGITAGALSIAGIVEELDADGGVWVRTDPSVIPGL
ncbi:MAG: hypothetical protein H0U56_15600 [Methylibium sp.]|nr:hypothetical protein [Methylibium sp.]